MNNCAYYPRWRDAYANDERIWQKGQKSSPVTHNDLLTRFTLAPFSLVYSTLQIFIFFLF